MVIYTWNSARILQLWNRNTSLLHFDNCQLSEYAPIDLVWHTVICVIVRFLLYFVMTNQYRICLLNLSVVQLEKISSGISSGDKKYLH